MAACNPENFLSSQLRIYRPDNFVFDQSGVRNNWAKGSTDMAAAPSPAPLSLLTFSAGVRPHPLLSLIADRGISFRRLSLRCSSDDNGRPSADNSSFCIIKGPETAQDFVQLQMQEIQDNIRSRPVLCLHI